MRTSTQSGGAVNGARAPVLGPLGQARGEGETASSSARAFTDQQPAATLPEAPQAIGFARVRLVATNNAAAGYFIAHVADAWTPGYLTARLGIAEMPGRGVGYAPAGWASLTDHLRAQGFSDAEVVGAGLGIRASNGRVVDRFRDRMMFPIQARDGTGRREVLGFVGRRNPATDESADSRNPKYLNTAQTPLYTKGEHLYGLVEGIAILARGGLAVVVEGPLDALAVDLASNGMLAGVALLGTALTNAQAALLAAALPPGSDRVVVAADADTAGQHASSRAYQLLTANHLDPRATMLPSGHDPASIANIQGSAELLKHITDAEPMPRQLVVQALGDRELTWPETRLSFADEAAAIISCAAPATWEREVAAVADRTGLNPMTLRAALVNTIGKELNTD